MELNKNELQNIADMLPIGYYAKARVSIEIDENADTSYFVPTNRKIFVSLKGVNSSLSGVSASTPDEAEKAVRAHLYHELSHAILTPNGMCNNDAINVFEDERIETLLDGFYHNVDFKANIKALCNFDPNHIPQSAFEKFFYACRFRIGKQKWLDEIEQIIQKHKGLNWNSPYYWDYLTDIDNLYQKITNEKVSKQDWQKMIDEAMQRMQGGSEENADIPDEYTSMDKSDEQTEADGEGEGKPKPTDKDENGEGGNKKSMDKGNGQSDEMSELMESIFSNIRDENLYQALDDILQNFAKKNKGGSAMQTYSGVFNPRNCVRDDYRFFDRKSGLRGSNPFGSLHLNLFIDDSGSFDRNKDAANKIIATMIDLSKKYSFFSVDFALCGSNVVKVDHDHAVVTANSGTHVQTEAISIVKKMQKASTFNYNIVLYDGWASFNRGEMRHEFEPWDMSNTTFILDPSCERTGNAKRIQNGKVIISRNYLDDLSKNILDTLSRAFR